MKTPFETKARKSSEEAKIMSRLDSFLLLMLPNKLEEICLMKIRSLKEKDFLPMTPGELIEFMGMCVLITRFELSSRRALQKHDTSSKRAPDLNLERW